MLEQCQSILAEEATPETPCSPPSAETVCRAPQGHGVFVSADDLQTSAATKLEAPDGPAAPVAADTSSTNGQCRSVNDHASGAVGSASQPSVNGHETHAVRQFATAVDSTSESADGQSTSATRRAANAVGSPLLVLDDILDDVERMRIATDNRLRALRDVKQFDDLPEVGVVEGVAAAFSDIEKQMTKAVERSMRKHPLYGWVKRNVGIGEKQGARLIAAIGDPYIKPALVDEDGVVLESERTRTLAELWAYCGYSPDQKRRKGVKSNWNATAKMRAYLCAKSCLRQPGSPLRDLLDARREHTAETHPDWTPGHSLNDALRVTAKAILEDLWKTARDLHEGTA